MPSQSRPLSWSYGSLAGGINVMNSNHLCMPDPNDFIRPTAWSDSGRNSSQLGAQLPPYPLHDQDEGMSPVHDVRNSHHVFLRQPTAEDFLPKLRSLSSRSVGECHKKQDEPVTEPVTETDSTLQTDSHHQHASRLTDPQPADLNEGTPNRRSKRSGHRSRRRSELKTISGCSKSEPRPPPNTSSQRSEAPNLRQHGRVQSIGSDTYQPTLGGLHKISNLQRKDSKRDKVKRAMSKLNPLRHQRQSWG